MNKFSLYDFLSLIFPGAVFLLLINAIRLILGIFPGFNLMENWETIILISIISGAILYVLSFYIENKAKWIYHCFGIHKNILDIYMQNHYFHSFINPVLNKQSVEWYGESIFKVKNEYNELPDKQKKKIRNMHSEFYGRMYHVLDFEGKLEIPKSFQSFYFFFRQLVIAVSVTLLIVLAYTLSMLLYGWQYYGIPLLTLGLCFSVLIILILVFSWLARWYRNRMVIKMYWFFYVYLNAKK